MIFEMLDDRKKKVLQIIVEDYIDSAEPIGSKAVLKNHHIEASPATIRLDMGDLEKKGFILKPHTSAGRVPSDKGYRFFIDNIMKIDGLSKREIDFVKEKIEEKQQNDILNIIGDMIASMSGNASIVVTSDKQKNLHISGLSRLMKQPEFSVSEKICRVIEALEDHNRMIDLLSEYDSGEKEVNIHVGIENENSCFNKCAVATTSFKDRGILSVVGPTRMDYEKISSILRSFSEILEDYDL